MKIDLETRLQASPDGKTVRLGDVFKEAVFNSQGVQGAKDIYEKLQGKEADLSVKEMSDIQKAVEARFFAGICWQIDEIINDKS